MIRPYLQIPDDDGISMQLLLGYVGLINVVVLSPLLVILVSLRAVWNLV
jgi:hypothetical protein